MTPRDSVRDKREIADSGAELDTLAGIPAKRQQRATDVVVARQAMTVQEAKGQLEKPARPTEAARNTPATPEIQPIEAVEKGSFTQNQLAQRWNMSPRTLERWRWLGQGPVYLKLGGGVSYRLEDIEEYEAKRLHANTTGPLQFEATKGRA